VTRPRRLRRFLLAGVALLAVAAVAWAGWQAFRVWRAWHDVNRVAFDVEGARQAMAQPTTESSTTTAVQDEGDAAGTLPPGTTTPTSPAVPNETLQAFLIIGSDQRPSLGVSSRADVILLFLLPADGSGPVLVSVPRDLYLPNPCTGGLTRINATLNGCGAAVSGPELLAAALEDFTGIPIDHFAAFDFEGFKKIVDRVGGVEICVDNPVRETGLFSLPAGCSNADGDTALAWMRSRHTQEQVNGVWRTMPGVSDLTRNQRQQDLLLQALTRLKDFRSVTDFASLVEDLSDAFTIDDTLSLSDAINLAWSMRGLDLSAIRRPTIPVSSYVTPGGAEVLLPQASFADVLASVGAGSITPGP
jgi:LCP family protein required for cell wall assembly